MQKYFWIHEFQKFDKSICDTTYFTVAQEITKSPSAASIFNSSNEMTWISRIVLFSHFLQREIRKIHDEIKEDYLFAVKKSIVDFVLKEPEIDEDERFLDEDDETPLTIELGKLHIKFNYFVWIDNLRYQIKRVFSRKIS